MFRLSDEEDGLSRGFEVRVTEELDLGSCAVDCAELCRPRPVLGRGPADGAGLSPGTSVGRGKLAATGDDASAGDAAADVLLLLQSQGQFGSFVAKR